MGLPETVLTGICKLLSSPSSGFRARLAIRSRPLQESAFPSTKDLLAYLIVPQDIYDLLQLDASEKDRLAANYVCQFSQTKDGIKTVISDHAPNS